MDKAEKEKIIMYETSLVDNMDSMTLMLNFAKLKHMNMNAPTQDDRDISHAILTKIQLVMKQRNMNMEVEHMMSNGAGFMVSVGNPSPTVHDPKKVVKKVSTVPKTLLKKVSGKNTLHFHDLMNANEERVAKEGELV